MIRKGVGARLTVVAVRRNRRGADAHPLSSPHTPIAHHVIALLSSPVVANGMGT